MAQGADQARRERELTKAALSADLGRLEERVRAELDWRGRLQRDGLRYAVIGTVVVVVVAGGLVARHLLRGSGDERAEQPADPATTLDQINEQLTEIRRRLDGRGAGRTTPLWQKGLLRATAAAGAAAGSLAVRRVLDRHAPAGPDPWPVPDVGSG